MSSVTLDKAKSGRGSIASRQAHTRPSAVKARKDQHQGRRLVRGGYDAAQTTDNNSRHWANTDDLSPDAAASSSVRRTLRKRARYEVQNNSYARGIVQTIAADVVGTGPRLQLMTDKPDLNRLVEEHFQRWAEAVKLGEKLRTMRVARCQDGESFTVMVSDQDLPVPVKLDLQMIEAEQVQDPLTIPDDDRIDGIKVDKRGKPVSYRVVTVHPGDAHGYLDDRAVEIKAADMIHLFRMDRPGLHRGIPEITPALPLFAQLRRFTLATISAAETAANFSGVIQTDAPADDEVDTVSPLDVIEIERNAMVTMPQGWKLGQFKAEQPSTGYKDFKREILNEIARCLGMPYNIAAANSADYNYASGRLDHQTYFKAIRVDQDFIAKNALDRIFESWLREYARLTNNPALLPTIWGPPAHQWFWDGMEHVDPLKEASAQAKRLENSTTTLAQEYARQGKDWEKEVQQRANEVKLLVELGLRPANTAGA